MIDNREKVNGPGAGPQVVGVKEVARRLGVSVSMVYNLFRCGRLASLRIGASRKVSLSALEDFVREEEEREAAERAGEVRSE